MTELCLGSAHKLIDIIIHKNIKSKSDIILTAKHAELKENLHSANLYELRGLLFIF